MLQHSVERRAKQTAGTGRNTAKLIDIAGPHFEAAHYLGVMALYATPMAGRYVQVPNSKTPVVDFVRCSYLGLDNHPQIVNGAIEAVRQNGTLHWSCARTRLNFVQLGVLEEELSALFNTRVITFSTVLAANMSALPLIASGHLTGGMKPVMAFDRLAHASLAFHKGTLAGETIVETIPHNDYAALEELCKKNTRVVYICDGVYSMGGYTDVTEIRRLQGKYGLFVYIDDAHGISIFGKKGEGFARSQFDELGGHTIIAASLGKGFGASGGMLMLGTAVQEALFRRFAIAYGFSASINTAAIGAALASAEIHHSPELHERQTALKRNIAMFDNLVTTDQHGSAMPIRTVEIGDELQSIGFARELLAAGYYVSAIFFPTVARNRAGLRVSLTAAHTAEQIEGLCSAMRRISPDKHG